ncbi:MAG TPA: hypothetical protein VEX70_00140 [Pyrinomonadaceae bacterium]|nr:hypothetical protein [Pyrinomonadaceae bacterium]
MSKAERAGCVSIVLPGEAATAGRVILTIACRRLRLPARTAREMARRV